MRFDHLIILVHDLEKAAVDFRSLGFTVVERADIRHGSTRFRFITFEDGSYLLLTAFRDADARAGHRLGPVLEEGEGWGDYSFCIANVGEIARRLQAGQIPIAGPVKVTNRVDGRGAWSLQLLMTGRGAGKNVALPFFVSDVEGRDIRIPGPSDHANGARGISGIRVAACNPFETARALELAGATPLRSHAYGTMRLNCEGGWIELVETSGNAREGLLEAVLTASGSAGDTLDLGTAHGAAIRLGVKSKANRY